MISLLGSAGGLPQDDPGAEHCTKDKIARNDAPSGPALGAGTLARRAVCVAWCRPVTGWRASCGEQAVAASRSAGTAVWGSKLYRGKARGVRNLVRSSWSPVTVDDEEHEMVLRIRLGLDWTKAHRNSFKKFWLFPWTNMKTVFFSHNRLYCENMLLL